MDSKHLFVTVLEPGNSKIKVPADLVTGENRLLVTWQRCGGSSRMSFIRTPVPFMKAPSLCPNHFPKALPPNTTAHWGLDFNI